MRLSTKLILLTFFLAMSVFFERFFFIVIVYKTKYFGYLLILFVIMLNTLFHFINSRMKQSRHKRRLY
jgi:hypothetical protein